ncbi:MAG: hypothetical protein ABIZ36_01265 [Gemmatimonadaceae bacterium]
MSNTDLWHAWFLWMGVATAVIVIAAALLITIWLTARGILAHAKRAIAAAAQIRENTQPIWALNTTNEVASQILDTVQAIEAKGGKLVEALESHAGGGAHV